MKKLLKTIAITLLLVGIMTLFTTSEVKAVLQSNTSTQYKKTANISTWLTEFRKMESNALGLSETINITTLLATSDSNNLDSHMMKSTEYGAIAILSASAYGNQKNDKAITSTTDNNTGMILDTNGKWEWIAGGVKTGPFASINARYFDEYISKNSASAKVGDALGLTWHSASENYWVDSSNYAFKRGGGGIFSFVNSSNSGSSVYARGVIVCGEGL